MPTPPPRSNTVGPAAAANRQADREVDRQEGRARAHRSGKTRSWALDRAPPRHWGAGGAGAPPAASSAAAATFRELGGDSASRPTAGGRAGRKKRSGPKPAPKQ